MLNVYTSEVFDQNFTIPKGKANVFQVSSCWNFGGVNWPNCIGVGLRNGSPLQNKTKSKVKLMSFLSWVFFPSWTNLFFEELFPFKCRASWRTERDKEQQLWGRQQPPNGTYSKHGNRCNVSGTRTRTWSSRLATLKKGWSSLTSTRIRSGLMKVIPVGHSGGAYLCRPPQRGQIDRTGHMLASIDGAWLML